MSDCGGGVDGGGGGGAEVVGAVTVAVVAETTASLPWWPWDTNPVLPRPESFKKCFLRTNVSPAPVAAVTTPCRNEKWEVGERWV
jgi:hypothetical protein